MKTGWGYRPELDGLRCIAVYLVLLFHVDMAWMAGGFIGVDVFFVLSGFLVTHVIFTEIDRTGRLHLFGFYARRVRRLLPAAVAVVVAVCATWLVVVSLPLRLEIIRDAQAALLYLANWHFILESQDYFAADTATSPFLHFWSLAIEEQFYFFYPALVLLVVRRSADGERRLLPILVVLGALSVALQVWHAAMDPGYAYYATEARLYQLLAGAVLALVMRRLLGRTGSAQPRAPRIAGLGAGVSLIALVLMGTGLMDVSASVRGILATVFTVALLAALSTSPGSRIGSLLARSVPVYLGRISYGTYLWHWPVILFLGLFVEVRPLVLALFAGTISTALAALSFQLLELPVRASERLRPVPRTVVASGLGLSLLTAVFVVPPMLSSERRPATAVAGTGGEVTFSGRLGELLRQEVPDDLDFETIAKDRGHRDIWCPPDRIEDCLVVDGEGPTVVVIGDSHGRMVTPAFADLAHEHGLRLYASLASSCPWHRGVWNVSASEQNQQECRKAREQLWDATLPAMDPDLVVLSAFDRSHERWSGELADDTGDRPRNHHALIAEGVAEAVQTITALGSRAVIVETVMGTGEDTEGWDPLDCLARARRQADCVVYAPPSPPVADSFYAAAAATRPGVGTVDVNRLVCPTLPVCAPFAHGEVVWRNNNHLTAAVVRAVRHELWEAVEAAADQPSA